MRHMCCHSHISVHVVAEHNVQAPAPPPPQPKEEKPKPKPGAELKPAPAGCWADGLQTLYAEASSGSKPVARLPPIIYTSRTHSQLAQVIRELKRTSYRHVQPAACQPFAGGCLTRAPGVQASHDSAGLPAADVHAPHRIQGAKRSCRASVQSRVRRRQLHLVSWPPCCCHRAGSNLKHCRVQAPADEEIHGHEPGHQQRAARH